MTPLNTSLKSGAISTGHQQSRLKGHLQFAPRRNDQGQDRLRHAKMANETGTAESWARSKRTTKTLAKSAGNAESQ
jgi:hypothetical protein